MAIQATNKNLSLLFTLLMGPISIILLIISVYFIQPKVEAKLVSNVEAVLKKHNIEAEVSFSGRDGILRGEVDSQEVIDNAQKISLTVFGTRVIRNYLSIRAKENDPILIGNIKQNHIFRKISYIKNHPKKEISKNMNQGAVLILKDQKKPAYLSEVDKIMANMNQLTLPVIPNTDTNGIKLTKLETVLVKIKNKTTQNDSNELPYIINNFNYLLESDPSELISFGDKQQISPPFSKKLDEIDLSTLIFSSHSVLLPKKAHLVLNKVSESIKAHSYSYIELTAYAEDSDIGYARGVAIRDYLATKGIQKNLIHITGDTQSNSNKAVAVEIIAR